jgi:hypothetical protein
MPERGVDDLAGTDRVNDAALAEGLESCLDASLFIRRERWRLVLQGLNDVTTGRKLAEFRRDVLAVPRDDFGGSALFAILALS